MNAKLFLIIGCIGLILFVIFSRLESRTTSSDNVWRTETFQVTTPAYLNAKTNGGHITVRSHNKNEITVHIFARKRGQSVPQGEEIPMKISISESENGVDISSESARSGWFRSVSSTTISYDIYVPRQTKVHAQTSGGPVRASNIDHDVTLITSGGGVTAESVSGDVLARTSGGPISVKDVMGNLTARTSGGGIRIANTTGSVNARTSGGPITLERVSGSIEARTSGGPITADVRALVDFLTLSTSGGSITAQLPRYQGMEISAQGGSVQNNLDDFTGETGSRNVKGSAGGGGVPVELKTSGGSVRISYRE